jgi:hypothetical protein
VQKRGHKLRRPALSLPNIAEVIADGEITVGVLHPWVSPLPPTEIT